MTKSTENVSQSGSVSNVLIIGLLAAIVVLLAVFVIQRRPTPPPTPPLPDPSKMLAPLIQSLGEQRKDEVNRFVDAVRQVALINSNNLVVISNQLAQASDAAKKGLEDKLRQQHEETERLRSIIDGMTNRQTVVQQPVSPDPSAPNSPSASDGGTSQTKDDQSQQDRQAIGMMVGAAVCIAQPELCPFAALFGQLFSMFGGDGGTEVLRTVENIAKGNPPTNEQINKLKDIAAKNGIPPGAVAPLTDILRHAKEMGLPGAEDAIKALGLDKLDDTIKAVLQRLEEAHTPLSIEDIKQIASDLLKRPDGPGYSTETQKEVLIRFIKSTPALKPYVDYFEALPVH